ncbi:vWA domain-containing protein [Actinacidiphila paucisporea]|uniref:Predicted metal-dependent peptidase n=1 Tax=Actinacidiphila paucisporea TaxID=310782 RepID=A0A1M6Z891_9ACTN|nr:Predicted metal-dependent peptidase [Actinacidiphila paucisporea]
MSSRRRGRAGNRQPPPPDPRLARNYQLGLAMVRADPALGALDAVFCRSACRAAPAGGWALAESDGCVHANPERLAEPREWAWVLAHCVLHLGFGHLPAVRGDRTQPDRYDLAARCVVVNRFQQSHPLGTAPFELPESFPGGDEEQIAERFRRDGIPALYARCGAAGPEPDQRLEPWPYERDPEDWREAFARALTRTVSESMAAAGASTDRPKGPWDRALDWFVSSYPLLGGIAAGMTVVADADLARAHHISVAAVNAAAGEIYVNPLRVHAEDEWRFILAHEMLHAALHHADRRGARDPYLFNVACDFVINAWLLEMGVGAMPEGLLHDPELTGLSAEEVYERITTDLRRMRRLATLRGKGRGDILGEPLPHPSAPADYVDLDGFYRRGLLQGFDLHDRTRGTLPAGLVEEIAALAHPPLPWDVRLARWFDEYVPRPQPVRSFARPARRQASTPGIPRAGHYFPPEELERCTFGVVLDTSFSMDRRLLGKALGAIASYAESRDVPAARVVFCDAAPFDAGYLPATEIASRVRVRGRGGTVLQPGVELLLAADDFPPGAPVLVITDGACDVLRIRREHAFLLPRGARLPFSPRGPVFEMR